MLPIRNKQPCVFPYLLITTIFSTKVAEHEIQPEFPPITRGMMMSCHIPGLEQRHHTALYIFMVKLTNRRGFRPKSSPSSAPARKTEKMEGVMKTDSVCVCECVLRGSSELIKRLTGWKRSRLSEEQSSTCDCHREIMNICILLNMPALIMLSYASADSGIHRISAVCTNVLLNLVIADTVPHQK